MQQAMQPMDEAMRRVHEALFDPNNNPMTQGSDLFQIEYTYETKTKDEPKAETPAKTEEVLPPPDRFARVLKDDD